MSTEIAKRKTDAATTLKGYLERNKGAIMAAMPRGANYERFCRTVVNAISTTPQLAECSMPSLFLSCVKAFSVGIEPNGPTQEGYLVPFKDKGVPKAQFMPSYRGLISLARRSGMVSLVYADAIREGDKYKIARGTEPRLEHEPGLERGKPLAYYAVARMDDGISDFEIMNPNEIDSIRKRSKAANSGPWVTDYEEMAKKTVLRRLVKRLPMSVENLAFAQAVEADTKAAIGDSDDVIDVEGLEMPSGKAKTSPFERLPEGNDRDDANDHIDDKEAKAAGLVAEPVAKTGNGNGDTLSNASYDDMLKNIQGALTAAGIGASDADRWSALKGSKPLPEMPLAQLRGICRGLPAWIASVKACQPAGGKAVAK